MAGLFDTLALGSRSLSTYRKAIDTTGHNLANVNTAGYTRQRVEIESVVTEDELGPSGMGAEVARVVRMHSVFVDRQMQVEASITGSLQAREDGLRQAMSSLQETLDRTDASGTRTKGLSQAFSDFFTALQSVSSNPSSIPERQVFLQKAEALAAKFRQTDSGLASIQGQLDSRVESEVGAVNGLLSEIARLNQSIASQELVQNGVANDLRDSRQLKLEELSKFVRVDAVEQENGAINVVIGGELMVDGATAVGKLETFPGPSGNLLVRALGQTGPLALGGGSIEGTISVRDQDIAALREGVNTLAATFISEINAVHASGFSLTGSTGADLFTGSNAADIRINSDLLGDPALFQASGAAGEAGNNSVVLALAQMSSKTHAALGGQTFSGNQAQRVAALGQSLSTATRDIEDQNAIGKFVKQQRDSISAVSIDEEMANLVMFQKAFQASAKLVSMTDEMLATIIQM